MSSTDSSPDTRSRILDAAAALLTDHPGRAVSMNDIARAAGLSRQAIYLHFTDRTELLVQLSRRSDASARTPERQARIDEAPTALEALQQSVSVQAEIKPQLGGIATALDVLRRSDEAAAAAWREREHARLTRCRAVARRLREEGQLSPDYSVDDAARLIWAVTSQRVWDDLVVEQGWTTARYRTKLTRLLEDALAAGS